MSKFDEVSERFRKLKFMNRARAERAREIIVHHGCSNLLEVGFFKGKSSAYFAAILEDLGRGHLTTIDRERAKRLSPNIESVLSDLNLTHRVTPIFAQRSHTWEMAKMLETSPRPQFDFCYFDGGHTWDVTGFGLVLVDMLLKPGGVILVDDLNWTIDTTIAVDGSRADIYKKYSADEKAARNVELAFRTILPHLGYEDLQTIEFSWGMAVKPASGSAARPPLPAPGAVQRLRSRLGI